MRVYKLTDADGRTRGGTQWGEGITHEASGDGALCSAGWLHFYTDPLLAVLLNPIHANFPSGHQLWEAEAEGKIRMDHGLKGECTRLTTLREIVPPAITTEQRVRFAILCAKQAYHEADWTAWADRWLSGEDRSAEAAARAEAAVAAAVVWAAWEAARAAMWEAKAAAGAAVWAAEAVWAAKVAVARAAEAAARAGKIDLIAIAREAVVPDALSAQAC